MVEECIQIPQTMLAVVKSTKEEPPELKTIPVPTPSANELLIKIMASPCSGTEVAYSKGQLGTFPMTMGGYGSGIVVGLGENVPPEYLTKKVFMGSGRLSSGGINIGCWAQYAIKDYKKAYLFSQSLTFEETCAIYMGPMTSMAMHNEMKKTGPHAACIQTAACSSIG